MPINCLSKTMVPRLARLSPQYARSYSVQGSSYRSELRVGRYGLQYSTTGYGQQRSQGNGGKLLHLVVVTWITDLGPDFDVAASCLNNTRSKFELNRQDLYGHGAPRHHTCYSLKVGDIVRIDPICVDSNARGVAADTAANDEPEAMDTDVVDCRNCLVRKLGVDPAILPSVEDLKAEARGSRAAAAAARPRCPNCGDERPKTKATERGERIDCSWCVEHLRSAKYFGSTGNTDLVNEEMAKYAERKARGLRNAAKAPYITQEVTA